MVIIGIIVSVTAFFTKWARSDERFEHKAVYRNSLPDAVPIKADGSVARFFVLSLNQNLSRPFSVAYSVGVAEKAIKGFYTAPIRNAIMTFVRGNVPPVFAGAVRMNLNLLPQGFSGRIVVHGSGSFLTRATRIERLFQQPLIPFILPVFQEL
jgi:hypothetical protein